MTYFLFGEIMRPIWTLKVVFLFFWQNEAYPFEAMVDCQFNKVKL